MVNLKKQTALVPDKPSDEEIDEIISELYENRHKVWEKEPGIYAAAMAKYNGNR